MISEQELERNLIKQLSEQGYEVANIKDEDTLIKNFKEQLEKFNGIKLSQSEFCKILTHLAGGTIFEKAKKLRDKFELLTDKGGNEIYFFLGNERARKEYISSYKPNNC